MSNLDKIAVIGMAGRFPGADSINEFWQNITNGIESMNPLSDEELTLAGVKQNIISDPNYVKVGRQLKDADKFDAKIFGFNKKEAQLLDPQIRLLLENVYHGFEDAGLRTDQISDTTGLFVSTGFNHYLIENIIPALQANTLGHSSSMNIELGNNKDFAASYVSYKFNLKGPSCTISTACSSSLVAIHQASQALLNYECDTAVAASASIDAGDQKGYMYAKNGISSHDGRCKPFDENSNGTCLGSGVATVVLKRLEDAIADNDYIYACIIGSATNNDGNEKVGFTAPSATGQKTVIREAIETAEIEPQSITLLETHGTGTQLGDPIEIRALKDNYPAKAEHTYYLGTTKANVGHLDSASGITGFVKAVLSLENKIIPQAANFTQENPLLNLASNNFAINTKNIAWEDSTSPRRAAVSSFGIGGTNAHVILEDYEQDIKSQANNAETSYIMPFSANSLNSLKEVMQKFCIFLEEQNNNLNSDFSKIINQLQHIKKPYSFRHCLVVSDINDAINQLKTVNLNNNEKIKNSSEVVFLFPGQGAQYAGMAKNHYISDCLFQQTFEQCLSYINGDKKSLIKTLLLDPDCENKDEIHNTEYAQLAIFIYEYSLAKMWQHYGTQADYYLGHSLGEYTAACLAGLWSLNDTIKLVTKRAELMQSTKKGSMLAVGLTQDEITSQLDERYDIAAINAEKLIVVSASYENIHALKTQLEKQGIFTKLLQTSHAFHSQSMEPILTDFEQELSQVKFNTIDKAIICNHTGEVHQGEMHSPIYWIQQLRGSIKFKQSLDRLSENNNLIFMELGPGNTLSGLVKRHTLLKQQQIITGHSIHLEQPYFHSLAAAWNCGVLNEFSKIFTPEKHSHIKLPLYPFEKERHFIDKIKVSQQLPNTQNSHIYKFDWEKQYLSNNSINNKTTTLLLFKDKLGVADAYLNNREAANFDCINILDDTELNNKGSLLNSLNKLHVSDNNQIQIQYYQSIDNTDNIIDYSERIILLVQSLDAVFPNRQIDLILFSHNQHSIAGTENINFNQSNLQPLSQVVSQEYININTYCIDLHNYKSLIKSAKIISNVINNSHHFNCGDLMAIRGNNFYNATYLPIKNEKNAVIKATGVYVIFGGTGVVGQVILEYLIARGAKQIIVTSTSGQKNRSYNNLKENDVTVIEKACDILNLTEIKSVIKFAHSEYGHINGIFNNAFNGNDFTFDPVSKYKIGDYKKQSVTKVNGAKQLYKAINGLQLKIDFICMSSSIASQLGGIGYYNYSAANNQLDRFVDAINNKVSTPNKWLTINWDIWNTNIAQDQYGENENRGFGLQQGMLLLDTILQPSCPTQMIISKTDFNLKRKKVYNKTKLLESIHLQDNLQHGKELSSKNRIIEIWQGFIGENNIHEEDSFFNLGGDSLLTIQMLGVINKHFSVNLEITEFYKNPSINGLLDLLAIKGKYDSNKTITLMQESNTRDNIFMIHAGGGSVSVYQELCQLLAPGMSVYGVRASQKNQKSLQNLAKQYITNIKDVQPHGPYRLLGYCFGGLIAYEIANQLARKGDQIEYIGLVDTFTPDLREIDLSSRWQRLWSVFGEKHNLSKSQLQVLNNDEQIPYIIDTVISQAQSDKIHDSSEMAEYLQMVDNHLKLEVEYTPINNPLIQNIDLYCAKQDSFYDGKYPDRGWGKYIKSPTFNQHWIDGNHENILEAKSVGQIATIIKLNFNKSEKQSCATA